MLTRIGARLGARLNPPFAELRQAGRGDAAWLGFRSELVSWYEYARAYAEAKWPNLAPVSRRSVAEALVTVTVAVLLQTGCRL